MLFKSHDVRGGCSASDGKTPKWAGISTPGGFLPTALLAAVFSLAAVARERRLCGSPLWPWVLSGWHPTVPALREPPQTPSTRLASRSCTQRRRRARYSQTETRTPAPAAFPCPQVSPPVSQRGKRTGGKTERKATTIKLQHNRQVKIILLFSSKPGRRINWSVPFDSSLKKAKSCFIHGCSTRGEGVHKDKPQSSNGSGRKHVLSSAPRCNRGSKDG